MRFFAGRDEVLRARQAFDAAGYTLAALTQRLGPNVFGHLTAGEVEPLLRATRNGDRLDVMARLFLVGEPVPVDAARAALTSLSPAQWAAGGLVAVDGDCVRGRIVVRPLGDPAERLVAHDGPGRPGTVATDHVLGVSPPPRRWPA